MDDLEKVAREACRYTWERDFSGEKLDAYVDAHWKDHLPGMRRISAPFLATISRLTAERDGLVEKTKDVLAAARFLCDRLSEYDPDDEDHVRDFYGHVSPALSRFSGALDALATPTVTDADGAPSA